MKIPSQDGQDEEDEEGPGRHMVILCILLVVVSAIEKGGQPEGHPPRLVN